MNIFYEFDGKLYINITNACPCDCSFCIRNNSDSVGGNDSLWLPKQPKFEDILSTYENFPKKDFKEAVFCGYGEPMTFPELLLETAVFLKSVANYNIRINTNGLVQLMKPDFDISRLEGVIDSISISLNAPNAEKYNEIVKPAFGIKSYNSMLDFAVKVKKYVPKTFFTIVDIIGENDIILCKQISEKLDIPLRVRAYVTDNESYT